jgi:hypothetical protein
MSENKNFGMIYSTRDTFHDHPVIPLRDIAFYGELAMAPSRDTLYLRSYYTPLNLDRGKGWHAPFSVNSPEHFFGF